jgi:hypothetical protein
MMKVVSSGGPMVKTVDAIPDLYLADIEWSVAGAQYLG